MMSEVELNIILVCTEFIIWQEIKMTEVRSYRCLKLVSHRVDKICKIGWYASDKSIGLKIITEISNQSGIDIIVFYFKF